VRHVPWLGPIWDLAAVKLVPNIGKAEIPQ
jgi:hypothetical protein